MCSTAATACSSTSPTAAWPSVWLAVDERLDREVAVKLLRRDLVADETFASRFRREARSAARLGHPHVVAVHDQGEDDGDLFLVMELVPGRTLRQVVDAEGPLPVRRALDVVDGLLQALDAAHSTGLIHRDVKPENVLVRPDGLVKVADFGLARAVTAATTTNASGTIMGTVAYLSPEQVERGIADARSDVYAAGLVLFELLTGRKAFEGESPISIAYQHVHGSVPSPSSLVPSVPRELDALVALATARDPDLRPATAGDLLVELRRVRRGLGTGVLDVSPVRRAGAPTTAVPVGRPTARLRPTGRDGDTDDLTPYGAPQGHQPDAHDPHDTPHRRRRWPLVAALVALVLVAAGGGTGWWWFTAGPGGMTQVPRVASLSQDAAERALGAADLASAPRTPSARRSPPAPSSRASPPSGRSCTSAAACGSSSRAAPSGTAPRPSSARPPRPPRARSRPRTCAWARSPRTGARPSPPARSCRRTPRRGPAQAGHPGRGRRQQGPPADRDRRLDGQVRRRRDAGAERGRSQGRHRHPGQLGLRPAGLGRQPEPRREHAPQGRHRDDRRLQGPVMVAVPQVVGKQRGEATKILRAAGFQVAYQEILGGFFDTVRGSDPSAGRWPARAPR